MTPYTASFHEGENYRITCQHDGCGYDKVCSTEWGADQAKWNHRLDTGHICEITNRTDSDTTA